MNDEIRSFDLLVREGVAESFEHSIFVLDAEFYTTLLAHTLLPAHVLALEYQRF